MWQKLCLWHLHSYWCRRCSGSGGASSVGKVSNSTSLAGKRTSARQRTSGRRSPAEERSAATIGNPDVRSSTGTTAHGRSASDPVLEIDGETGRCSVSLRLKQLSSLHQKKRFAIVVETDPSRCGAQSNRSVLPAAISARSVALDVVDAALAVAKPAETDQLKLMEDGIHWYKDEGGRENNLLFGVTLAPHPNAPKRYEQQWAGLGLRLTLLYEDGRQVREQHILALSTVASGHRSSAPTPALPHAAETGSHGLGLSLHKSSPTSSAVEIRARINEVCVGPLSPLGVSQR